MLILVIGWSTSCEIALRLMLLDLTDDTSALVEVIYPDSKVHGANMGPTWVLSAPDGLNVGPMNLAIWVTIIWVNGDPDLCRHVTS